MPKSSMNNIRSFVDDSKKQPQREWEPPFFTFPSSSFSSATVVLHSNVVIDGKKNCALTSVMLYIFEIFSNALLRIPSILLAFYSVHGVKEIER